MIGGFLGTISRFIMSAWIPVSNGFPVNTLLINLAGSFLIGWFLTVISISGKVRLQFALIIGTGFIGSFTTFSTFSVETLNLMQRGEIYIGTIYIILSVVLGLAMVYLGHRVAGLSYRVVDS